MQSKAHAQTLTDRRQAERVDVDRRYTMRLDPADGRAPMICTLLDFSVTGVRLELPADVTLPCDVRILIGEIEHNCRIAWRRGITVGIDFVDEHHSII